jgi:hypothetical protein
MKVELTGIRKESLQAPTAQGENGGAMPAQITGHIVMAQFEPADRRGLPQYGAGVFVPYELVEGAQVGDVFTLHLERAK